MSLKEIVYLQMRFLLILIFILLSYFTIHLFHLESYFTPRNIQNIFEQNLIIASLSYIVIFTIGNLLQVPGWVFLAGAVFALGKGQAYLLTLIAAFSSCTIGYFIIRFIGKDSLREIKYQWVQKLLIELDKRPIKVNIILRLVFQTVPILNYTMALSGVKFKKYAIGFIIGLPLPILLYTIFINKILDIFLK